MLFKILLLLLFALPAAAQKKPVIIEVESPVVLLPNQFTADDTIYALHRLFARRRTSGSILLGVTGLFAAGTVIVNNNSSRSIKSSVNRDEALVVAAISVLYASPLWVVGTSKLARFSKKKEQDVINEFTAKHTLPIKIQRRLLPRLFAQAKRI